MVLLVLVKLAGVPDGNRGVFVVTQAPPPLAPAPGPTHSRGGAHGRQPIPILAATAPAGSVAVMMAFWLFESQSNMASAPTLMPFANS